MNRDRRQFVVYVAGPYRADTYRGIMNNVLEAAEIGGLIRSKGFTAVVPHLEALHNYFCMDEADWIEHGLSLVRRCHAVFDFRKGRISKGTEGEVILANILDIPVVTTTNELCLVFDKWSNGFVEE